MVRSCPWAFVLSALKFSTASLTSNTNLVTKVAFPKEVFLLSSTVTAFFDMMIAFVAVLIIIAIAGVPLTLHAAVGAAADHRGVRAVPRTGARALGRQPLLP